MKTPAAPAALFAWSVTWTTTTIHPTPAGHWACYATAALWLWMIRKEITAWTA